MAGKLSASQEKALITLLSEARIEEAASKAGVSERSLYRWLSSDARFISALQEARRHAVKRATGRLQQASADAVTVLCDVMNDVLSPAPARVSAAKTVIELAVKAIELDDLSARIEALEQAAKAAEGAQQ